MNKKTKLKRITLGFMSVVSVVTLVSCKETSTSSINTDTVYASTTVNGKTYSITNGELWNELKWSSTNVISDKISEVVLKEYKEEVNEALKVFDGQTTTVSVEDQKRYFDYLELSAFTSIYGTDSYENLLKLYPKTRDKNIATYVDNAYLNDAKVIDASKLDQSEIEKSAKTLFENTSLETTYYLHGYYEDFVNVCAQKVLAYDYLNDFIIDYDKSKDEDNYYYNDAEIIQHHSEKYQYAEDRKAIIIGFTNSEEIDSTLKAFGVKVYNDSFYFIPQGTKTNTEYSKYYEDFDVSKAANSEKCFNMMAIGGESLIFEFYLAMYNYIYTYKDALPALDNVRENLTTNKRDITESIMVRYINAESTTDAADTVGTWSSEKQDLITYSQDDLNDIDADFKIYVNKTLKIDADYTNKESRYSTSGVSYNDKYYMVFKVSEDALRDEYVLLDSLEDTKIPSKKSEYREKLVHEMMWDELTDSYISDAVSERMESVGAYIYDPSVEIAYSQVNTSYSKTHKSAPTNNTLFTLKYDGAKYHYTIDEVFEDLVLTNGVTSAIDLLSKKVIKDTKEYEDTNKNREDYETTIELLLSYFANDQLSSYPSTLGKYNFLMLYFHTSNIDEIIDNYYRVNEASNEILTDFGKNDKFYTMVESYAKSAYEKRYKVSASSLLVYVDMDEDGNPDEDFDWSKRVSTSKDGKTYKELAVELIEYMVTRMKNSNDDQLSSLTSMVEEYTKSQRFTNGIDIYDPDNGLGSEDYDPTEPETIWAEYKRAGILVKVNEYTDVTNSTTESYADEGCPTEIKNRIKELYSSIQYNGKFPTEYVDSEDYSGENPDGWKTNQGYSMIIITSASEKSSAKFETKDDINEIFKKIAISYNDNKIIIDNIYNTSDVANINQIKLFIYDYLNNESSTMLPETVQQFFTDYIQPIYEKYTDSSTQRELVYIKMLNSKIDFTNKDEATRLDKVIEINHRISDEYLANDDDANDFKDWWQTILTLKD